jgi:hypothetical protein
MFTMKLASSEKNALYVLGSALAFQRRVTPFEGLLLSAFKGHCLTIPQLLVLKFCFIQLFVNKL